MISHGYLDLAPPVAGGAMSTHTIYHVLISVGLPASHRWLQVKFQCHQHLVVDDKNFPLLFQTLHTWNINTMLFENYWAPFSFLSGKATQADWETRNCAYKCLNTGAEVDLHVSGCTTGFRGPGESPVLSLKAALDKITVQAVTSSSWGGPMSIQCCAACLPSPGGVEKATVCRKKRLFFSLELGLLRNLLEGKTRYFLHKTYFGYEKLLFAILKRRLG